MAVIRRDLILTGHYTGKTIVLNGHKFTNGVLRLEGSEKDIEGLETYYGKCYQAFPRDSKQLADAQARDAEKEAGDGERGVPEGGEPGSPAAPNGDAEPAGGGSPETQADDKSADADADAGTAGSVPSGDGHGDTGVPSQPSGGADRKVVKEALSALSADEDSHWTQDGKPAVGVITELAEVNVSRSDIETLFPDFNRTSFRDRGEAALEG